MFFLFFFILLVVLGFDLSCSARVGGRGGVAKFYRQFKNNDDNTRCSRGSSTRRHIFYVFQRRTRTCDKDGYLLFSPLCAGTMRQFTISSTR